MPLEQSQVLPVQGIGFGACQVELSWLLAVVLQVVQVLDRELEGLPVQLGLLEALAQYAGHVDLDEEAGLVAEEHVLPVALAHLAVPHVLELQTLQLVGQAVLDLQADPRRGIFSGDEVDFVPVVQHDIRVVVLVLFELLNHDILVVVGVHRELITVVVQQPVGLHVDAEEVLARRHGQQVLLMPVVPHRHDLGQSLQVEHRVDREVVHAVIADGVDGAGAHHEGVGDLLVVVHAHHVADPYLLLVVLVLALDGVVLEVGLVDELLLVDDEQVGLLAQHEGLVLGHIGGLQVEALPDLALEDREADDLVVDRHVELLLGLVEVGVGQERELRVLLNRDLLLLEDQGVGLVEGELGLGHLQHLDLPVLLLHDVGVVGQLVASALPQVEQPHVMVLVHRHDRAHSREHVECADFILGLDVEGADLEAISGLEQSEHCDVLLIAAQIEQAQFLGVAEDLHIGAMDKLAVLELTEAFVEEVDLVAGHHADHAEVDEFEQAGDLEVGVLQLDLGQVEGVVLLVLLQVEGVHPVQLVDQHPLVDHLDVVDLQHLVRELHHHLVARVQLEVVLGLGQVVVQVDNGEGGVRQHDAQPAAHLAVVEVQDVRVLLVVLLLVGRELVHVPHLLVVQLDHRRRLVQGHVVLGVGGVVELLHPVVVQQVVLLLQLLEPHLELRVLLLLLEVQDLPDHVLEETLVRDRFGPFGQDFVEHVLGAHQVVGPLLEGELHYADHQQQEVLDRALALRQSLEDGLGLLQLLVEQELGEMGGRVVAEVLGEGLHQYLLAVVEDRGHVVILQHLADDLHLLPPLLLLLFPQLLQFLLLQSFHKIKLQPWAIKYMCSHWERIAYFLLTARQQQCLYYFYCMLTARKEGFIIRKSRRFEQPNAHEQRRHMSQTEFYRKSTPISVRSPGHIVHVNDKEDNDLAHSNYFRNRQDEDNLDTNPENYGTQIKYDFEESAGDLRQVGEVADQNPNDKSYEEIEVAQGLASKVNLKLEDNVKLARILQKLSYQMQHRVHSAEVLECVKLYIEQVEGTDLASVNNLPISMLRRKILKDSLVNERLSVLLAGLAEILNCFQMFKSFLINIVSFSLDNLLLRLAILTEGKDKSVVELLKQEKKQKLLNKGYETIKNNNEMLSQGIIKVANMEKSFYDVFKKLIRTNKTMDAKNQFLTYREFIAYFLCETDRHQLAPFLSTAPAPFLPPQEFQKYTLVIDVFECLMTRSRKSVQTFRPFAEYFLDEMSQYYELVSFSDLMPNEANRLISLLDRKKHIKHRLFKHHMNKLKSPHGKDLSMLGRDMERVILIDTSREHNSTNTIVVSPWKGKKNDAELAELCPILAVIALKKLSPAKSIKKLQEKSEENMKIGLKHINCGVNLQ